MGALSIYLDKIHNTGLTVLTIGKGGDGRESGNSCRGSNGNSRKGLRGLTRITNVLRHEIIEDAALLALSDEVSVLEEGIIDSLSLLRLEFLEGHFKNDGTQGGAAPREFRRHEYFLRLPPGAGAGKARGHT
jgi:hypothetical protein